MGVRWREACGGRGAAVLVAVTLVGGLAMTAGADPAEPDWSDPPVTTPLPPVEVFDPPSEDRLAPLAEGAEGLSTVVSQWPTIQAELTGPAGLVVGRVGGGPTITLGTRQSGPAWSTSKVPVAIAALRRSWTSANLTLTQQAIRTSDNDAAAALITDLGGRASAAPRIEDVLRSLGDTVTTVSPTAPPGRMEWSNTASVRFAGALHCSTERAASYVYGEMGNITAWQRWGLGRISGARFKGGWYPTDGGYFMRQLGVIPNSGGAFTAVSLMVQATSFESGQKDLDRMALWLDANRAGLPASTCDRTSDAGVNVTTQGTPTLWAPLSAQVSGMTPRTYQWFRVDAEGTHTAIPGATAATYEVGAVASGQRLRVSVTGDSPEGVPRVGWSALTAVVASPPVERIAGADRYETAVLISRARFADGASPPVYIATGERFPDALAAAASAEHHGAALLLVRQDLVPETVALELARLRPREIVILGQSDAVSDGVAARLSDLAPVTRLAGANRQETALLLARTWESAMSATITTGANFPDALSAGSLFARYPGPILLSSGTELPAQTMAELARLGVDRAHVLGSAGAVAESIAAQLRGAGLQVVRLEGPDRYATSAVVATAGAGETGGRLFLTTGRNFPDGLSVGPLAASTGDVVMVADVCIRPAQQAALDRLRPSRVIALGQPATLPETLARLTAC